jgi:large subunit ribosomal protein L31
LKILFKALCLVFHFTSKKNFSQELRAMKKNIHPSYGDAKIICACGEIWQTKSTRKEIKVSICAKCHPFFTGKQKFVDTAGRVEKFRKRYKTVTPE